MVSFKKSPKKTICKGYLQSCKQDQKFRELRKVGKVVKDQNRDNKIFRSSKRRFRKLKVKL